MTILECVSSLSLSLSLSLHPIQKYNTIRMIDELIRYPIYLASALEIASLNSNVCSIHFYVLIK